MYRSRIIRIAALLALASVLSGCYQVLYRRQDESNLRRQLHVPSNVRMLSLDGYPKTAGFFGREGLQIHAVFEFDATQLDRYVATMNDPAVWTPEPLVAYSPRQAEEYSTDSMRWHDLPVPSWTKTREWYRNALPGIGSIERGRVYCSCIAIIPGDGPNSWRYVGRSCAEVERLGSSSVATVFGVIDLDARRLYSHISFAG